MFHSCASPTGADGKLPAGLRDGDCCQRQGGRMAAHQASEWHSAVTGVSCYLSGDTRPDCGAPASKNCVSTGGGASLGASPSGQRDATACVHGGRGRRSGEGRTARACGHGGGAPPGNHSRASRRRRSRSRARRRPSSAPPANASSSGQRGGREPAGHNNEGYIQPLSRSHLSILRHTGQASPGIPWHPVASRASRCIPWHPVAYRGIPWHHVASRGIPWHPVASRASRGNLELGAGGGRDAVDPPPELGDQLVAGENQGS